MRSAWWVSYDIADPRRLGKISKWAIRHGERIQKTSIHAHSPRKRFPCSISALPTRSAPVTESCCAPCAAHAANALALKAWEATPSAMNHSGSCEHMRRMMIYKGNR